MFTYTFEGAICLQFNGMVVAIDDHGFEGLGKSSGKHQNTIHSDDCFGGVSVRFRLVPLLVVGAASQYGSET
jgi:hypothetical protein